jgi:hypothetical protein
MMKMLTTLLLIDAVEKGGPGSGPHPGGGKKTGGKKVTGVTSLAYSGMYRIHYGDGTSRNFHMSQGPLPKVGDIH